MKMGINVMVTGVTGMVGEGVLLECLRNHQVDSVLAVCRKALDLNHPKLKILVAPDFLEIDAASAQLTVRSRPWTYVTSKSWLRPDR